MVQDHGASANADRGSREPSQTSCLGPDGLRSTSEEDVQFVRDVLIVSCEHQHEGGLHKKGARALKIVNQLAAASGHHTEMAAQIARLVEAVQREKSGSQCLDAWMDSWEALEHEIGCANALLAKIGGDA